MMLWSKPKLTGPRALLLLLASLPGCHGDVGAYGNGRDTGAGSVDGPPAGWVCGPSTCPDGCCQDNKCRTGTEDDACGGNGAACFSCSAASPCTAAHTCACDPSCLGCCGAQGCQSGTENSACGKDGETCAVCGPDDRCTDGSCARPCPDCSTGCCSGSSCEPGTADTACGKDGDQCKVCGAGTTCQNGICVAPKCDATTCPNGCCDAVSGACVSPPTNAACGLKGDVCVICGAGDSCDVATGTCVRKKCDATWCKTGCCDSTGYVCVNPPTNSACGLNGDPCKDCGATALCNASTGKCETPPPKCDATSCAAGCCNAAKTCISPPTPSACGLYGNPCQACQGSQICSSSGQCVCSNTCSSSGQRTCAGNYSYQTCTPDYLGCLSWVSGSCAAHEKCVGSGQCVCEDECTPGSIVCDDQHSVRECKDTDGDGCTEKKIVACTADKPTCKNGRGCTCDAPECSIGEGWYNMPSTFVYKCYHCAMDGSGCIKIDNYHTCPTNKICSSSTLAGPPTCQ